MNNELTERVAKAIVDNWEFYTLLLKMVDSDEFAREWETSSDNWATLSDFHDSLYTIAGKAISAAYKWQPMASAPKNRSVILLHNNFGEAGVSVGIWGGSDRGWETYENGPRDNWPCKANGWLPIPQPDPSNNVWFS